MPRFHYSLSTDTGYPLHSSRLLPLLGLPATGPIPPSYSAEAVTVSGVQVRVLPANHGPKGTSRFGHRVQAACPTCGKWMSAGRLHQHEPIHD